MTDAYLKINIFEVWGRDRVLAVASEIIRNNKKLEVLAEIRMKNKEEIDSAADTIREMRDDEERARYVRGLPLAFQSIIILDCLRELEKVIKKIG